MGINDYVNDLSEFEIEEQWNRKNIQGNDR